MADILKALIIVLMIDAVLLIAQISLNYVADDIGKPHISFYNVKNSTIMKTDAGGYTLDTAGIENRLYDVTPAAAQNTGDFFTDTVKDIKNWFVNNIPGLNYLLTIIGGPAVFLAVIGAPVEICFILGSMWFIFTIVIIVMLITGRN